MHQNNKIRNPHNENTATRRTEIVISFDVPEEEATQQWMDAVIAIIKREVVKDLGKNSAVTGKWL